MQTQAAPIFAVPANSAPVHRGQPGFVNSFRALLYGGLFLAGLFGGPIVQAAAVLAAAFAFWGDLDGGVRHLARLCGLGVAIWLAPKFAAYSEAWLAAHTGMSLPVAGWVATGGSGIAILIACALLARGMSSLLRRSRVLGGMNKVFGGMTGAAEGALLVATVCWMTTTFDKPLADMQAKLAQRPDQAWLANSLSGLRSTVATDPAGRWLQHVNPLSKMPMVATSQAMADAVADPQRLEEVMRDERVKEFFELPVVNKHIEAIRANEGLRTALREHDMLAVMQSPQFLAMLSDRELFDAVMARWDGLQQAFAGVVETTELAQPTPRGSGGGSSKSGQNPAKAARQRS